MSKITHRIEASNFEVIRDRIATILKDELVAQGAYGDTDVQAVKVWASRFVPFDKTDMPAVNVNFFHGDTIAYDVEEQTMMDKYSIDIHTGAKWNTAGDRGDSKSVIKMQKIMGICAQILRDAQYRTLGFPAGLIWTRHIESISVANPMMVADAESLIMGRIVLNVKFNEDVTLLNANLIKGYDTQVKIELTDKGYFFKVDNY